MAKGKVVQVIGTVVDVEFPGEELPPVNNAVEIAVNGDKLLTEVQQHLGNNWVRCLAMGPTEGLRRGAVAKDLALEPCGDVSSGDGHSMLGVVELVLQPL